MWIATKKNDGDLIPLVQHGLNGEFSKIQNLISKKKFVKCAKDTLKTKDLNILVAANTKCRACPTCRENSNLGTYSIRLQYGNNNFGSLTASLPLININEPQQKQLFRDLAQDIGFALHKIELENKKNTIEKELHRKHRFQQILTSISSNFLANPQHIEAAVDFALQEIGTELKADHANIVLMENGSDTVSKIYEWYREASPENKNYYRYLKINRLAFFQNLLKKRSVIAVENVSKMPARAEKIKTVFHKMNIQAFVILPLHIGQNLSGFLGVDYSEVQNPFSDDELEFITVATGIISNALLRRRTEEALIRSEQRYLAIFNQIPISIWEEDFSDVFMEIEKLKKQRLRNFRDYFNRHPDKVMKLAGKVRIIDVNNNSLLLFSAKDKVDLLQNLDDLFTSDSYSAFRAQLIAIAEGKTQLNLETEIKTIGGKVKNVIMDWTVAKGHEQDYSRVFVSIINITERIQTEKALLASEEKFRTIVENSHAGVAIIDSDFHLIYVNRQFAMICGYNKKELIGVDFRKFLSKGSMKLVTDRYRKRQQGKRVPKAYELNIQKKDGRMRRVELRASVIHNFRGSTITIAQILDITEQKELENKLIHERDLLHALMDNIPDTIYFKDRESKFTLINKAHAHLLGLDSADEAIGKRDADFFERKKAIKFLRDERRILETGDPLINEFEEVTYPDGSKRWISMTKVPIFDKQKRVSGLVGISRDITEQIMMEKALRDSELMFRNVIEQSNDAIYLLQDSKFKLINRRFTEIFQYTLKDTTAPDFDFMKLVAPESMNYIKNRLKKVSDFTRKDLLYEFTALSRDGRRVECEVSVSYIDYLGKSATLGIIRDITERKRAEAQIVQLAQLIEQSSESIVLTDLAGDILYVNAAFCEITGYLMDEVIGKNPRILKSGEHDKKFYEELWASITEGKTWHGTFVNRKKDGTVYYESATIFPVRDLSGKIINFAAVKRDITQERELEEQFRQAQKMEAIGQLAGGVAHDFNNLLTIIRGYSELALDQMHTNDPLLKNVEQIDMAAQRAEALTRQLLAFSRRQILKPDVINLNTTVRNMEKMLRRLIGENISLHSQLDPELKNIRIDEGQIEQVIMNLVINARDAMPAGGRITLETQNTVLNDSYVSEHEATRKGEYVMIAVSDTGIGMSKEIRDRVFEPFFTTKEKGKGTGLGLSTVYGIIKQSNGNIWLYSEPDKGTTFKIYLPVFEKEIKTGDFRSRTEGSLSGNETILLVEDEENLRKMAVDSLQHYGYTVLTAENGKRALDLCRGYEGAIDLLLTDVVMPEINGRELSEEFIKLYPHATVVFTSGYTDDAIVRHGMLENGVEFIQKPFTPVKLLRKLRSLLNKKSRPSKRTGGSGNEFLQ